VKNPSHSYDAIILGAGAAGLLCAAESAQRGRRVTDTVIKKVLGILSDEEKLQLRHLSLKLLRAIDEESANGRKTHA